MHRMKDKKKKIIILVITIVAIVVVGIYFFMKYRTYHIVELTMTYENNNTDNANYIHCFGNILRYGRDGIALLEKDGGEIWNQSCQMSNPIVEMCGDSVAVGDKGGTSILVFEKKGLKGEIKTTKPIEKIAVSSQGIVCAMLKDDENPLVMCYDAVGNKLVEHKVLPKTMGYPIDVALSTDGKTLLVSYLYTGEEEVTTKVVYYYFGDDNTEKDDYQVYQQDFAGSVIPVTAFLTKDISILVADNGLIFFKGLKEPRETARINIDTEIQCVGYGEKLVAVVVDSNGATDYKLNIYNKKGKLLSSVDIEKEYTGIKVTNNQVILYDGQTCGIYLKNGVCKYQGNLEQKVLEMYPLGGLNKYMVINTSGFYELRLVE